MKTRDQIDEKYKWDLTDIIKDQNEIEDIFKIMENLIKELPKYSGKLGNKKYLLERFTKFEQDEIKIGKLYFYLHNNLSTDNSNTAMLENLQRFNTLYSKIKQADSYFTPQMSKLSDKYLQKIMKDENFKNHKNTIKEILRNKPHVIDENSNKLLNKMSSFLGDNDEVFHIISDSELEYEDVKDKNGKIHKLDNANCQNFIAGNDPELRKNAFNSRLKACSKFNKTFAELYVKNIEFEKFYAKLHNFDSVLDCELFGEEIPKQVFDNIIKFTSDNIPLLQDYVKTQNKLSKNKDFAYYDLFEDKKLGGKINVNQACETILKAFAPLGEDYINRVKSKLNDKSIDFLPNKNKRTGAYCSNCYGAKTLILMNFAENFDSVSTLIHEMGHCINAEYFNEFQPEENAGITIFSAEIASTVNEILLNQYMLNSSNDKKQKSYYLHEFLDGARSTIYRQVLFSEFEVFAHNRIENEKPLTYEDLNKCYEELNNKYYGKSCKLPTLLRYEWSRIPHFYNAFYVYSYATGMVTAITIANKILTEKDFYKKYIYFLKNGTEKPPIKILQEIGIDLMTEKPYVDAFNFIKQRLSEYKKINNL